MLSLARRRKLGMLAACLAVISWAAGPADPDGTLHIKDLSVPLSNFLSPEARSYMLHCCGTSPLSEARAQPRTSKATARARTRS